MAGKPRVQGNSAEIHLQTAAGIEIFVGEFDKCTVKDLGELKKSKALGQKTITSHNVFNGYDIDLEGGKVDWKLANVIHAQQIQTGFGGRSALYTIRQKITYFDGSVESWNYPNCTLHGYEIDMPSEGDLTEKFMAFCGTPKVANESAAGQPIADIQANDVQMAALMASISEKSTNAATDVAITPIKRNA